jgi:hypothetical protein
MKKLFYIPTQLLTTRNTKTLKGEKYGWTTYILHLSPFNQNDFGKNVCPMASAGCAAACLNTTGRASMNNVQKGRKNKTHFFLSDRENFLKMLHTEIAQAEIKHKIEGSKFTVRLNGTSDISWEKFIIPGTGKNIFDLFPKVNFYDYTKNHLRFAKPLPKNYKLVFSRSETNEPIAIELLKKGVNVAFVFKNVPSEYKGFKVINGDESDLRFLDKGNGIIIGLKYKNLTGAGVDNSQAFKIGFAIQ